MKIVPDANIYVSSLVSQYGNPRRIIDLWLEKRYEVLISQPILEEIERVLRYPRIVKRHGLGEEDITQFVKMLAEQASCVEPLETLQIVTEDESDNRYLECALAGGADYLVSGDEHLLRIENFQGIFILNPTAFLILLNATD